MTDTQHEARMLNFALRSIGTIRAHMGFLPEEHVGRQLLAMEVILEDMDRVLHTVVQMRKEKRQQCAVAPVTAIRWAKTTEE